MKPAFAAGRLKKRLGSCPETGSKPRRSEKTARTRRSFLGGSMKKRGNPIKTVYYRDEKNDEFSDAQIEPRKIDGSYRYDRDTFFGRLAHFFWYRIVAVPLAFCYLHLSFSHRMVNRKAISTVGRACFVYGNHTQPTADALIPTFLSHPHDAYVLVHANNVSMPVLGKITPYLGALPLPDDLEATRNFQAILEKRVGENAPIFIYPEAHIWPYYTGIRPFSDQSFFYPVKYGTPVFCFTNTYQRRRFSNRPKLVTYVDGPFYPDESLPVRERRKALREQVYACMCERSKKSDVVRIEYCKETTEQ